MRQVGDMDRARRTEGETNMQTSKKRQTFFLYDLLLADLTRAVNGLTPPASPPISSWQPTSPSSSSSPLLPLSSSPQSSFPSRSHDPSTELSRLSPSRYEEGPVAHLSTRLVERSQRAPAESAWPPDTRDTTSPTDDSSDETTSSLSSRTPRSEFGETNSSFILVLLPSVDPQQTGEKKLLSEEEKCSLLWRHIPTLGAGSLCFMSDAGPFYFKKRNSDLSMAPLM